MAHLLIACADQLLLDQLTSLVARERHTVETIDDGATAFELIRKTRPDMVIAAIRLPRMPGLELLRAIRADVDHFGELPVAIMTEETDRAGIITARREGADDVITTPLDPEIILAELSRRLTQVAQVKKQREQQLVKLYGKLQEGAVPDAPNNQSGGGV